MRASLPHRSGRTGQLAFTLAALSYAAVSLWLLRAVVDQPGHALPSPVRADGRGEQPIGVLDQAMTLAIATRNAALATSEPLSLPGGPLCHPMPRAHTLGEHVLGFGLLAAPAHFLTGDPLVAYNLATLLSWCIAGLAMYALAVHYTRSPPAAWVAGLLFAFAIPRISDPAHPFAHGDLWTPLVLLAWARFVERGRWRDALALAAVVGLQLLESLYSVLECAVLLAVFGGWIAWRGRAVLRARLPRAAVAGALVAALGWAVFEPYLATRSAWHVLADRHPFLNGPSAFWLGGLYFPGLVAIVLAVTAMLDRWLRRGSRERGPDPRGAMLLAGIAAAAISLGPLPLAPGVVVPAPLALLRDLVPGLDAMRAHLRIGLGASLAAAFLAAFGVVALGRRRPWRVAAVAALAAAVALVERGHPRIAAASFGRTAELAAMRLRPSDETVDLLRRAVNGPTVDLPTMQPRLGALVALSEQIVLAAYHGQSTSSCYNSFQGPVPRQVSQLAARLPDPRAAEALAALGFRNVVAVKRHLRGPERDALRPVHDAASSGGGAVRLVGETPEVAVYALVAGSRPRSDWSLLGPVAGGSPRARTVAGAATAPLAASSARTARPTKPSRVLLAVENAGGSTFRHPEPVVPSDVRLLWEPLGGTDAAAVASDARVLLPLALASGDRIEVEVETSPPAPGRYALTLLRRDAPRTALARALVSVSGDGVTTDLGLEAASPIGPIAAAGAAALAGGVAVTGRGMSR
jgi:hypothetical protein